MTMDWKDICTATHRAFDAITSTDRADPAPRNISTYLFLQRIAIKVAGECDGERSLELAITDKWLQELEMPPW